MRGPGEQGGPGYGAGPRGGPGAGIADLRQQYNVPPHILMQAARLRGQMQPGYGAGLYTQNYSYEPTSNMNLTLNPGFM